ncbi:MAG TPA: HAMP domain-containing sensor histidine kinase, partial [Kofleriaceae bacterium]|nr:HAMP domain-containing sensor histidine kinase [Kofleriaceae bacterium]
AQVATLEPSLIVLPSHGADSSGPLVAMADTKSDEPQYEWIEVDNNNGNGNAKGEIGDKAAKTVATKKAKKPEPVKSKTIAFDQSAYEQNAYPQQVYTTVNNANQQAMEPPPQAPVQQAPNPPPQQAVPQPAQVQRQAPAPAPAPHRHRKRVRVMKKPTPAAAAPATVQVTIAPIEWRTTAIDGEPALAGVRRVDTPDGSMTQGLVVLASAADEWLGERGASGSHVTSRPGADQIAAPIGVPGWYVTVDAHTAIAAADADALALERQFLGRFVPVALLAMICGALVVLVVARAEKLARERARFAAAAAHELRTPLAGLQLYGDMLADGLGDPGKQRDYAKRMAEEASRLGRVVSNVLGFSQLERGNLSVHPAAADVASAIRASCDRAKPALERAGVSLAVELPDTATARFDHDALARVIGNLLDNAEKYGREGADRRISISLANVADKVEISVEDHGPGVPERAVTRLFRPFVRAAGADGPPGLGLGLALSRSMAQAMGGDLVHRETRGGGATFVIVLPRA